MPPEESSSTLPARPESAEEKALSGAVIDAAEKVIRPVAGWLTPLIVPPGLGLMLIGAVMLDLGNPAITDSPGAASTALVVGTLLILGSATLFVLSPFRYDHFFTDLRKRVEGKSASKALPPGGGTGK
jgi:hypothetical protein